MRRLRLRRWRGLRGRGFGRRNLLVHRLGQRVELLSDAGTLFERERFGLLGELPSGLGRAGQIALGKGVHQLIDVWIGHRPCCGRLWLWIARGSSFCGLGWIETGRGRRCIGGRIVWCRIRRGTPRSGGGEFSEPIGGDSILLCFAFGTIGE